MKMVIKMPKKVYIGAIFFFLLDLLSKTIALPLLKQDIEIIPNFFYLTLAKNDGAAFSSFSGQRLLLIIISIAVVLILVKIIKKEELTKLKIVAFAMLLGGVIGNLFDRLIYGYVIDFLSFFPFGYAFPIFNLADTFIVIGVFLYIIASIGGKKHANNSKQN